MKRLLIAILTVFCIANPTWADGPYKVTGKVVEKNSEDESSEEVPLALANVVLETDQKIGTQTDEGGKFSLDITKIPNTIKISYPEYESQYRIINSESDLNVGTVELKIDVLDASNKAFEGCSPTALKYANASSGRLKKGEDDKMYCDPDCNPSQLKAKKKINYTRDDYPKKAE